MLLTAQESSDSLTSCNRNPKQRKDSSPTLYVLVLAVGIVGSLFDCAFLTPVSFASFVKGLSATHVITGDIDAMPESIRKHAGQLRGRALLAKRLRILPIEAIVRGYITGSAWNDYVANGASGTSYLSLSRLTLVQEAFAVISCRLDSSSASNCRSRSTRRVRRPRSASTTRTSATNVLLRSSARPRMRLSSDLLSLTTRQQRHTLALKASSSPTANSRWA